MSGVERKSKEYIRKQKKAERQAKKEARRKARRDIGTLGEADRETTPDIEEFQNEKKPKKDIPEVKVLSSGL